jgi:outer membrane protein OmpA-like peptidoglycan-associated protein
MRWGDSMTKKRVVAGTLALLLVSGCGWWSEQGRTTKGAVYGTGAGAAAGAAIGAVLGGGQGAWKGAAVGAAVGALSGGLIGHYQDNQAKEMQQVLDRQDRLEREGETLRVSLSSDVLFDSGSAMLKPGAEDKLRQVAEVLNRYPRTRVEITGHTDSRGSDESNQLLSERRADSVRALLARDGVDPSRITTRGLGATRPVAGNDTTTGRAMNRRVDIVVQPDEGMRAEDANQRGAPPPAPSEEPR